METDAARSLVGKVREFAQTQLEDEERALFAMLVAHGIAQAYPEGDVQGFAMTGWQPDALPAALVEALRASGLRVVESD
jgi:hypothetical protein